MAEYRLTPAAQQDLDDIFDYTAREWGLAQAIRYVDLIEAALGDLAARPRSAPPCDDVRPGYRRRQVQRHVLYVREEPYGVSVVRIMHDRMEPRRHL